MEHHLRPVPPAVEADPEGEREIGVRIGGSKPSGPSGPSKSRQRPKKALPTDRMKFEVQKKALNAIGILGSGDDGVNAADMAATLDLAPTTAGLNNTFFFESALVARAGKGRYKSTEATDEFARRFSFDQDEAGQSLKGPLSGTWYYETVEQHIRGFGPTPKEKLIELLAYRAETTKDYRVQLGALLSWLEYADLIELTDDGRYKLASDAPVAPSEQAEPEVPTKAKGSEPPTPNPEGTTSPAGVGDQSVETILGFSFDFALTGDQLAKLSPEQITALFRAVGEVMAIKAATD